MDEFFEDVVIDWGSGTATPSLDQSTEYPTDYDLPGLQAVIYSEDDLPAEFGDFQENKWKQILDTYNNDWEATADVKLDKDGQANLPLQIYGDDAVSDDAVVDDDYETIEWEVIDSAPFGFSQERYVFSENDDAGTTVNIPLSLDSLIKTATILIFDSVFQPIVGDAANNTLDNVGDGDDLVFAREGNDYVDGWNGNDRLYGEAGKDTLLGNSGNDYLDGDVGDDDLSGEAGNDTLDGGFGIDTLVGGTADDTYIIDSTTDTITEYANEGVDTVESSVSFTLLDDNLENLTLTGGSDISGTGNALDNVITDDNYGDSTLIGGKGNDTYIVDGTTTIIEYANEGVDTVESRDSYMLGDNLENLTIKNNVNGDGTGNALDNIIIATADYANSANNSLDGGLGTDTLIGGTGGDTYIVDSTTDTIIEDADEYYKDTVESSVSFTLGDNLENLTLTGSSDISGTGNALDNVITGNDGINTLIGGKGNDTYIVDSTTHTIIEYADEGVDTIEASVSFTLGDNLENLNLKGFGDSNISGTGNALDNTIDGSVGNDTLTGGAGADTFVYVFPLEEFDTITDFNWSEGDKIEVSASGFGIGATEYNRFMYDSSTGALFFDQTQFASLQPDLGFVPSSDITIV